MTLEETMATIAAGQSMLVESMTRLLSRLEDSSPRQQVVNDLANGIGNINLDRAVPPHQNFIPQNRTSEQVRQSRLGRPSYAPIPQEVSELFHHRKGLTREILLG